MPCKVLSILMLVVFLTASEASDSVATARSATQDITLTGYTRARTVIDLSTETDGKVEKVFADMGQKIPQNGKFACLDKTFVDLAIESNRADIERSIIDIDYFTKQVSRHRQLVNQNNSAQIQLDDAIRGLNTARQQSLMLKTKALELAERKRRYCIAAPPGWIVMKREIEPGEWVKQGDAVAKIGDFSRLLIPLALSMSEFSALNQSGDKLQVTLPALEATVPAHVEHVAPGFDEQSRKIILDLEIEGDLNQKRGGLRAQLTLNLPAHSNAVLLPQNAVDERYEQHWVQRTTGERIKVVYLGRAKKESTGDVSMVRVSSPDIGPGQQFVLFDQ